VSVIERPLRGARIWRWTTFSGVALLVLVTVHMVAHHFVVEEIGGLRDYANVLDYVSSPIIVVSEATFLVAVTIHAMLGLRGVLYDLGPGVRARRRIDVGLIVLGAATIAYGAYLLGTLVSRAA
jgi:succinate dehydrogenase hydrophobic anchor subunit